MRKVLLALVSVLLIVAMVVAVRTLGERDETDAVDAKDASAVVGSGARDDADGGDAPEPGLRPEPGTYTYAGAGREQVDVLGGSEHVFPDTIPAVVELDDEDGCAWTWDLVYVKQHVEERAFCTTAEEVVDRDFVREIEFFGRTQEARFDCSDDAVRYRTDAAPGMTWSFTCRDEEAEADATYDVTVVGPATLTIDGSRVRTQHTKVAATYTGGTVGTDDREFWIAPSGLIVRFRGELEVKTDSVLGETTFTERARYELTSMDPERD